MEKSLVIAGLMGLCLASCDRDKSIAADPAHTSAPAIEVVEPRPPAAIPVAEPQEFKIGEEEPGNLEAEPTPGQRLDHAIEKTQQGVETGVEKTEEGVRKGAGATGRTLQRVGEAIERKASGR
jgi:hypothetical protein